MNEPTAKNYIESYIRDNWEVPATTPVAWKGQPFDGSGEATYIKPDVHVLDTVQSTTGAIALERFDGLLTCWVVTKENVGDGEAWSKARDFKLLFNRKTINKIVFETGKIVPLGEAIAGKMVVSVEIPFWVDY